MPGGAIQTASGASEKMRGPRVIDCASASEHLAVRRSAALAVTKRMGVIVIEVNVRTSPDVRQQVDGDPCRTYG